MSASRTGWVKIHRSILDWEWFDDALTLKLFLFLLLSSNTEDKAWRGITIKRGQLVTSLPLLSENLHMSVKQVRLRLEHLAKTQEIETLGTRKYTIVTICNYDSYQLSEEKKGIQRAYKKADQRAYKKDDITDCTIIDYDVANNSEGQTKGQTKGHQLKKDILYTNTTYIVNNISLSTSERERILSIFIFLKNFQMPVEELSKFINHYQGRDWTPNGSSKRAETEEARMCLAKNWEQHPKTQRFDKTCLVALNWICRSYQQLKKTNVADTSRILTDLRDIKFVAPSSFVITISEKGFNLLESAKVHTSGFKILYKTTDGKKTTNADTSGFSGKIAQ